jgi:predicted transcriptional regulator
LDIFSHTRNKYRGKQEVYATLLLGVAAEHRGIALTRLMYTSMVSHRQLTHHLQVLLKHGLLEYNEQEKVYKITTRGLKFLELYTKMAEMLKPIT